MQCLPSHRFTHDRFSGIRRKNPNMRIIQNLSIHGNQRRIQNAGCRYNDLIGGIAVKIPRKLSGLDADTRGKFNQPNPGVGKSLLNPIENRTRQGKPPALDQLGHLPVSVRHGFCRLNQRDRLAAKRMAGALGGNRCARKDNHLDGIAATERNAAQRNHAILGQCGFGTVRLHGEKLNLDASQGKRTK